MCCLDLIECFFQELKMLQLISGFRKNSKLKKAGVAAKRRGIEAIPPLQVGVLARGLRHGHSTGCHLSRKSSLLRIHSFTWLLLMTSL